MPYEVWTEKNDKEWHFKYSQPNIQIYKIKKKTCPGNQTTFYLVKQ